MFPLKAIAVGIWLYPTVNISSDMNKNTQQSFFIRSVPVDKNSFKRKSNEIVPISTMSCSLLIFHLVPHPLATDLIASSLVRPSIPTNGDTVARRTGANHITPMSFGPTPSSLFPMKYIRRQKSLKEELKPVLSPAQASVQPEPGFIFNKQSNKLAKEIQPNYGGWGLTSSDPMKPFPSRGTIRGSQEKPTLPELNDKQPRAGRLLLPE